MSTTKWALDASHSSVGFKVKHLMITTVTGSFSAISAEVETEGEDFTNAKVSFKADVDSITTGNEQRDAHLKSPDFFDVLKFPDLTFSGSLVAGKLNGELTLDGVTKSVSLPVEFNGVAKDPWGNSKAGLEISGSINRKDFGLEWNAPLETGGVLVSEDIKLVIEAQLLKQA